MIISISGLILPEGIDIDNQKQREEQVLMNDALKLKNNPSYTPVLSAGGEYCTLSVNIKTWLTVFVVKPQGVISLASLECISFGERLL